MSKTAILLLGGNLGNPYEIFKNAITFLFRKEIKVLKKSSIYESPPWGYESKNKFYNMAVLVEQNLSAPDLLAKILEIEILLGRERALIKRENYTDRLIDIDILTFGNDIIDLSDLKIPHPLLPQRRFALEPLIELQPKWIHPKTNESITDLLQNCTDNSLIRKIKP